MGKPTFFSIAFAAAAFAGVFVSDAAQAQQAPSCADCQRQEQATMFRLWGARFGSWGPFPVWPLPAHVHVAVPKSGGAAAGPDSEGANLPTRPGIGGISGNGPHGGRSPGGLGTPGGQGGGDANPPRGPVPPLANPPALPPAGPPVATYDKQRFDLRDGKLVPKPR